MFFPTVVASMQGLHPHCAGHPHSLEQMTVLNLTTQHNIPENLSSETCFKNDSYFRT